MPKGGKPYPKPSASKPAKLLHRVTPNPSALAKRVGEGIKGSTRGLRELRDQAITAGNTVKEGVRKIKKHVGR